MRAIISMSILLFIFILPIVSATEVGLLRNSAWSNNLTGLIHSSLAFGDIDNDGDYDLILTGCSSGDDTSCTSVGKSTIYVNNGNTFIENAKWQSDLESMGWGSLAFGDIDNDGDLDLAMAGYNTSTGLVRIYINNGSNFVRDAIWNVNLMNLDSYGGSVAFGDVNNDGLLDLALVGASSADNGLYINNGSTLTKSSEWLQQIPQVGRGYGLGVVSWGDVNNDNLLDLVFAGSYTTNFYDDVYINNGTSLIGNQAGCHPCGLWGFSSQTLGDYNNDGDIDLAYMGTHGADRLYVYNNNGSGTFAQGQLIIGLFDGSVAWGDYDNDGDLDVTAIGKEPGGKEIVNNNETIFQYDATAGIDFKADDLQQGSLAWSDVDNDGNLDLACIGLKYGNGYLAEIYISNLTNPNAIPNAPTTGFVNEYNDSKLNFSWSSGSDNETPTLGLYYNLRVGTCSGCHDVVSGVFGGSSNPTAGYFGNMMQRKSIILNRHFEPGTTVYWAVQTIDTGLAKSAWSEEQVYMIPSSEPNCTPSWSCSSWGACQSGGTQSCGSWVDSNDCNETYNGSNIQSCTYEEPDSPGGGSRPSGGSTTLPKIEYTFDSIEPGIAAEKEISDGVSISVRVKNAVSKVTLAVRSFREKLGSFKEAVRGKLYGYLEVNSTGLSNDDIEEAYIDFRVNRSWIEENEVNPETVKLNRYENGNWAELDTELVGESSTITGSFMRLVGMITGFAVGEDEYYTYRAKTPGFSYFAITAKEWVEASGSPSYVGNESNGSVTGGNATPNGTGGDGPPQYQPLVPAAGLALAAAAIVGTALYLRKRSRKPQTMDEALMGHQP